MLVSVTIENLINGVSQQPDTQRLPSQCEIKENCYDVVVDGCGKRPASDHIKTLDATNLGHDSNVFTQIVDYGAAGKFLVTIAAGTLRVFDLDDGVEKTVAYTAGLYGSYLGLTSPATSYSKSMKLVKTGDYQLLLNRSIATSTLGYGAQASVPTGINYICFVRQGQYSTTYKLVVTLNSVTYTSTKTTSDSAIADVRTTQIATDLCANFSPSLPATVTAVRNESTVQIKYLPPGGGPVYSDFKVVGSDSGGDDNMTLVQSTVQRFTDLPTVAPNPYHIVKVIGENASLSLPYYVQFVPDISTTTFGKGTWVETFGNSGTFANSFNTEVMPHKLVRETDGSFTLSTAAWGSRTVGDETNKSAPFPTFITGTGAFAAGTSLDDLFIYKNRLGILANNGLTLSRFGQFLELFPSTVVTLLDTGPILIDAVGVRRALPSDSGLLLFSQEAQSALSEADALSASTVAMFPLSTFDNDTPDGAAPIAVGKNVYFPYSKGNFSGLREYFVDKINGVADASDINVHVPKYIEGDITSIAASTHDDVLVCRSETDPSLLNVYKWYWSGDQKLQSSWSQWTFGDCTILGASFVGTHLYTIIQRPNITLEDTTVVPGGAHLERMTIAQGETDPGSDFQVLLGRKISSSDTTVVYSAVMNRTTWTLPYRVSVPVKIVVRVATGDYKVGQLIDVESQDGYDVVCKNDLSSVPMWLGESYSQRFQLSKPYLRRQLTSGASIVDASGRLQLRRMKIIYRNSAYFRVEITPANRSTYTKVFSCYTEGNAPAEGEVSLLSGEFPFLIQAKNDEVAIQVINDSHLPSQFISAEYEAMYTTKSQRA